MGVLPVPSGGPSRCPFPDPPAPTRARQGAAERGLHPSGAVSRAAGLSSSSLCALSCQPFPVEGTWDASVLHRGCGAITSVRGYGGVEKAAVTFPTRALWTVVASEVLRSIDFFDSLSGKTDDEFFLRRNNRIDSDQAAVYPNAWVFSTSPMVKCFLWENGAYAYEKLFLFTNSYGLVSTKWSLWCLKTQQKRKTKPLRRDSRFPGWHLTGLDQPVFTVRMYSK